MTTDTQLETILVDYRENELPPEKVLEAIKRVVGNEFVETLDIIAHGCYMRGEREAMEVIALHKKRYTPTYVIEDEHGDRITVKEDTQ